MNAFCVGISPHRVATVYHTPPKSKRKGADSRKGSVRNPTSASNTLGLHLCRALASWRILLCNRFQDAWQLILSDRKPTWSVFSHRRACLRVDVRCALISSPTLSPSYFRSVSSKNTRIWVERIAHCERSNDFDRVVLSVDRLLSDVLPLEEIQALCSARIRRIHSIQTFEPSRDSI